MKNEDLMWAYLGIAFYDVGERNESIMIFSPIEISEICGKQLGGSGNDGI